MREPTSLSKWIKATDVDFGRVIRIEASDARGVCKCVTCDYQGAWDGGGIHAGHFIGNNHSIRYVEMGVHPQCFSCNTTGKSWSLAYTRQKTETVSHAYQQYMLDRYGQPAIDALNRLKAETRTLVEAELRVRRCWYKWRLKVAKEEKGL